MRVVFQDLLHSLSSWMREKVSWPDFAMARLNSLLKCAHIFWVVLSLFIIALDKIEHDFLSRGTPWRWFSLSHWMRYVLCLCIKVHLYLFNLHKIRQGKFKKQIKIKQLCLNEKLCHVPKWIIFHKDVKMLFWNLKRKHHGYKCSDKGNDFIFFYSLVL